MLTAALILGAKVASETALVVGFVVGAVAYARLQRQAFSPEVDRRELLAVVATATVAFYILLTLFMVVTEPEALSNASSSPTALRMLIRVYLGYPVMTAISLVAGLGGVRRSTVEG